MVRVAPMDALLLVLWVLNGCVAARIATDAPQLDRTWLLVGTTFATVTACLGLATAELQWTALLAAAMAGAYLAFLSDPPRRIP